MPSLFFFLIFKQQLARKELTVYLIPCTKNFIVVGKLLALSVNIACMNKFSIKQQLFLQHLYHNEEFRTSCDFFPITFCTSTASYFAVQVEYVWL